MLMSSSGEVASSSSSSAPTERPPKRHRNDSDLATGSQSGPVIPRREPKKALDPADNSHFWMSSDGMARFAGTTSGLPLLSISNTAASSFPAHVELLMIQRGCTKAAAAWRRGGGGRLRRAKLGFPL